MAARGHHIISVGKRVNAMTTKFKKPERPEGLPARGAARHGPAGRRAPLCDPRRKSSAAVWRRLGFGLTAKWHAMSAWRDLNDVETATLISAASFHERWQPEEMTQ